MAAGQMDRLLTHPAITGRGEVAPSPGSKWIDRGILNAFRPPGGPRRVRSADLRRFLVEHQMPVPEVLGTETSRLLIADAEPKSLESLKRAFKAHPVELTVTSSGVEALL